MMNNKPEYFDVVNIKDESTFNYFHKQNKEKVKIYYTNYLFGKNCDKSKIIILDINKNKTCLVFVIDSNIYHETLATVNFCYIYDNNGKTYKVPGACRNNFK